MWQSTHEMRPLSQLDGDHTHMTLRYSRHAVAHHRLLPRQVAQVREEDSRVLRLHPAVGDEESGLRVCAPFLGAGLRALFPSWRGPQTALIINTCCVQWQLI